ncbi:hypothetical protein ACIGGE_10705 [Qipengyuania sp. NPDC077410]|uniref:hypothetical protein n=1 Tax=Qipengyuania sp. NPDC077410 TaxID=3364496 RepID=UPI0037CB2CA9
MGLAEWSAPILQTGKIDTMQGRPAAVGMELMKMSTTYAVKMRRSKFIAEAHRFGWQANAHVEPMNGHYFPRMYLHDGSVTGYVWDIEEERALDREWWTLFTRYAGADVSALVAQFGAIAEHDPRWEEIFCDEEQLALREVRDGAASFFEYWSDFGGPPCAKDLMAVIDDEFQRANERWKHID